MILSKDIHVIKHLLWFPSTMEYLIYYTYFLVTLIVYTYFPLPVALGIIHASGVIYIRTRVEHYRVSEPLLDK